MRIQFKIPSKKNPMTRHALIIIIFLFVASASFSQTDSTDHFLQKGILEKEKGRRMESLKNFEKAARYDNNDKAVLTELAAAYFDLRKYSQARETYKKLVELGDQSAANYKQLLNLSFNLKQQDDVILYANQLKKADPSEKINYYLGKIHYDRENYGEAIQRLNDAAKEDPENGEIPYMIARSYADMMNYKQAIPFFQKAVQLDTSKNHWIYEMGLIYYAIHDDKNALKCILEAGDKGYKKDNDYLENLGIAYLNVGNLDQGVAIMNEILKRKPSDINILNIVAEYYYSKGKYQLAIDYWDQILGYDKQNASALYMIGMSYQKKGEKGKGELLCDKAIQMDPSLASLRQKKQMMGL